MLVSIPRYNIIQNKYTYGEEFNANNIFASGVILDLIWLDAIESARDKNDAL